MTTLSKQPLAIDQIRVIVLWRPWWKRCDWVKVSAIFSGCLLLAIWAVAARIYLVLQ